MDINHGREGVDWYHVKIRLSNSDSGPPNRNIKVVKVSHWIVIGVQKYWGNKYYMMQTVVPNIDTNILVSDDSNFVTAS